MNRANGLGLELKNPVIVRVFLVTVLLGAGAIVYYLNGSREEAFFLALILASVSILSLSYLFLDSHFHNFPDVLTWIQIAFDIILASGVIYVTGGTSSPFIFLYALIIVYASLDLNKTASYITASLSGIFYIIIVAYMLYPEFSLPADIWKRQSLVYSYFNLIAFILIAMLSGILSERIVMTKRQLGESNKRLRMLENLYENIIQSLTSGVITLDLEGTVISVNKQGLEILGIESEHKVIGENLNIVMPNLRVDKLIGKTRELMVYSTPGGRDVKLGFSSSVLRDNQNEMQGHIIIFQDLTEVKQLEERLRRSERMALLGQLAAGLAHELRNPISAISGAVETISNDFEPTKENMRLIKVATQEVERLNLLVEDFLLLTIPIVNLNSSIDISKVINATIGIFTRTRRRDGIDIVTDIQEGLMVAAESYRIKQVMWNLLYNAMDAMPEGGSITVDCGSCGDDVLIKVSDNGYGIDNKIITNIFEPFFTTKEIGTGLGLAIVKKVIEGYNGNVSVISKQGEGTTFLISLPRLSQITELV